MNRETPADQERYDRAKERVEMVRGLYSHIVVFVLVNLGLAAYNLATSPDNLWFLFALGGWGIGLVAHGLYVASSGRFLGPEWEARKIREELEREQRR